MTPRVFCLDPHSLPAAKARVSAGDPALRPALARLCREADEALKAGPFSVMDKEIIPPSGDKHNYMSYGPYWWPDPEKEDGLPYIRRDGEVNPEAQHGTDRQAIGPMTASVETLALAYYLMGEDAYAEHAAHLLRVFFLHAATRMNPHLEYGQAIPGRVTGRGVGIIDTLRLAGLVDAIGLLSGYKGWTAGDQAEMVAWFDAYLAWLRTSAHGLDEAQARNNHGTWYDVQVASFALFVGNEGLAGEVIEASRELRIASQIEPDGRQPWELARTKALGYSAMNLRGMFALASLGDRLGVALWHYTSPSGGSIRAALGYLAPYADPQVAWPHQQIAPISRLVLLPLLHRGALIYGDGGYEEMIAKLPPEEVTADRVQLLFPK